ncbi:MAG TPA: pyrroline-5-carboxylate reductase dimerization domain-containing protein [Terriglobales bacterium]|nr:pyrroline-5-carboxylate reductase dimerization domain-containing protein [Terriglobales bacterium]
MKATVFIGGGRITSALLAGLRLAKYPGRLLVYDHHPQNLQELKRQYGVTTEKNLQSAIAQARILVIAVRPASVRNLLKEIGQVKHRLVAVSLGAGIPLSRLRSRLGKPVLWARAMPSPACRSGRGLTALTFARSFPTSARREVKTLFAAVGSIVEIPESEFDAFTVTYSCSHGYHALATLAEAGERLGLDKEAALYAAAHALADGIEAWREGHVSLRSLLQEAATPGGIAATVIKAMDRTGYKKSVQRGLAAGFSRATRNSKLL